MVGGSGHDGIDQLGEDWRLVNPGVFFKQYPVCSASQAAVELTQRLMEEHDLRSNAIRKVVCEVPPLVAISLIYDKPRSPQEAQFSLPFAVGTMLARGRLGLEDLANEALSDAGIRTEMAKVEMHRVDSLEDPRAPECARVTLLTNDDGELTEYLGEPTGMPGNPMSDDQLNRKFLRCTAVGGLRPDQSATLLKHLTTIESVQSGLSCFDFGAAPMKHG